MRRQCDPRLPRTAEDKRKVVARLLADPEWAKWADREIGRICAVSPTFVGTIRAELSTVDSSATPRTYKKRGKTSTMKTAEIGKSTRKRAAAKPDAAPKVGNAGSPRPVTTTSGSEDLAGAPALQLEQALERARQAEDGFAAMQARFFEATAEVSALKARGAKRSRRHHRPKDDVDKGGFAPGTLEVIAANPVTDERPIVPPIVRRNGAGH
jgi:hypothetical protein